MLDTYQISISKYAIECAGLDVFVTAYKRTFGLQILTALKNYKPTEEEIFNVVKTMQYTVEDLGKLKVGDVMVDTIRLLIVTNK